MYSFWVLSDAHSYIHHHSHDIEWFHQPQLFQNIPHIYICSKFPPLPMAPNNNWSVFLISFLGCSWLVYRSTADFCILISYPATLLSSSISFDVFFGWWIRWDFLCIGSCHLLIESFTSLFQFGCLFFLAWLLWLEVPIYHWKAMVQAGILALSLISGGKL